MTTTDPAVLVAPPPHNLVCTLCLRLLSRAWPRSCTGLNVRGAGCSKEVSRRRQPALAVSHGARVGPTCAPAPRPSGGWRVDLAPPIPSPPTTAHRRATAASPLSPLPPMIARRSHSCGAASAALARSGEESGSRATRTRTPYLAYGWSSRSPVAQTTVGEACARLFDTSWRTRGMLVSTGAARAEGGAARATRRDNAGED